MSTPKHTFVGSTLLLFLGPNIRLSPPTLLGTRQCLGHPHFPLQAVPPTPPHRPPVPNTFHPPGRPTPSLLRSPSSSLQRPLSQSPLSSLLLSGHTLPPCPGAPRRTSPLSHPASPAHLRSLHPARQASAQGRSCPPTHVLCPHPGTPSPAGMAWAFFTARAAGPPRHRAPRAPVQSHVPSPGALSTPVNPTTLLWSLTTTQTHPAFASLPLARGLSPPFQRRKTPRRPSFCSAHPPPTSGQLLPQALDAIPTTLGG